MSVFELPMFCRLNRDCHCSSCLTKNSKTSELLLAEDRHGLAIKDATTALEAVPFAAAEASD
jgi:hypothetical protein